MNDYKNTAKYYDLALGSGYSYVDIDFYLRHIRNGMRILDVGCGTGRVSLEIARARKDCVIDAIDVSKPMIDVFREKLSGVQGRLKSRIDVKLIDMREIEPGEAYDLIICPFQSFQTVTGKEGQLKTLAGLRSRLKDDGKIIVSVFDPTCRFVTETPVSFLGEIITFNGNCLLIKMEKNAYIDWQGKTYHFTEQYQVFNEHKILEDEVQDDFCVAYHEQRDLLDLFLAAGLEVENKYQDYNCTRLRDDERSFDMIFVLRKAAA